MHQLRRRVVRARFAVPLFAAMFLLGGLVGCQSPAPGTAVPAGGSNALGLAGGGPSVGDADEFLIVDCLLPAQIRRLGSQVTYLAARRGIRTSGLDCEIRGGEYVAYDRANYATALAVWLEPATAGDPQAQTYVGEIYERGLGVPPDYAMAAEWYRRAAEQDYAPAQINLGQLYEQGRGVPRDQVAAINWYRRASGFDEAGLTYVVSSEVAGEMQDLRDKVMLQSDQATRLRDQIKSLESQIAQLESTRRTAEPSLAPEPTGRARAELGAERQALESMRDALEAQRRELAAKEQELAAQRAQGLDDAAAAAEVEQLLADLQAREGEFVRRSEALAARAAELSRREQQIADREAEVASREQAMAARQGEISELDRQIAALRQQFEDQRQELAELSRAQPVALAGPEIRLIDPQLPAETTRGMPVIRTRGDVSQRPIIGRVDAPAGLLSVVLNDRPLTFDDELLFSEEVPIGPEGNKVSIVAVDRQGKRAALEFMLAPETQLAALTDSIVEAAPAPPAIALPPIDFGNYHALVIGNNAYTYLPELDTAIADAEAVADLLASRYGFQVTLLRDATRYQILSALNELRASLSEDDNLLVYYAGHGTLDEANNRGNWLPIDAEADNSANWISNVSITDILNAMSAKHILVVADSCYSGALTRTALAQLDPGMSERERHKWLTTAADLRSRTALTSGGLAPTLDGGGGGHSVFARAFLDALAANDRLLEGQQLHREIAGGVIGAAEQVRFQQIPEYAPINHTGHVGGDFLFVPKAQRLAAGSERVTSMAAPGLPGPGGA
jgi:cell division protein FtsL